jgi:hypothetical protein
VDYTSIVLSDTESIEGRDGWSRAKVAAAWALVVIGLAFRLARYFAHNSLWHDESTLALNLVGKTFGGLLKPLDYGQGAPVGFLMLEKVCVTWFGTSEYALRLVPQLAGLISVPLFYRVARRVLGCGGTLVALAIFAGSDSLVQYSAEVKQYSLDVAVGLGLWWLGLKALQDAVGRRWWVGLALAGAVAVWLSHPALFVLGGVGLALAIKAWRRREGRLAVSVVGARSVASFAANYGWFTRVLSADPGMLSYWAPEFAPLPGSVGDLMWYLQTLFRSFKEVWGNPVVAPEVGHLLSGLGVLVGLTGVWWLWRERRGLLVILLTPMVLTLLASALHRYPFRGRLMLFDVPVMVLLMSAGVEAMGRVCRGTERCTPIFGICVVLLAGLTVGVEAMQAVRPSEHQATRQALEALKERYREGDVVYLYPGFCPPFTFYTEHRPGFERLAKRVVRGDAQEWPGLEGDLTKLREELAGGRGLWMVYSSPVMEGEEVRREGLMKRLATIGELKTVYEGAGGRVVGIVKK